MPDPIKGNTTSVNNLGFIPDNYLEDIINKDMLIQENNKLASQWATNHPNNVVQRPVNNDKIDYPSTDIRSKNYSGNPNWSFAVPNMTGKQRAEAEAYHGDLIGTELLGTAIFKGLTELQKLRFTTDPNKFYRQIDAETFVQNKSSGLIKGKQYPSVTPEVNKINLTKSFGDDAYYNKGSLYSPQKAPYLYEVNKSEDFFIPKLNNKTRGFTVDNVSTRVSKSPFAIKDPDITLYEKNWLGGYKKVPTSEYENGGIRNINNNNIGFLFNESFGIQ